MSYFTISLDEIRGRWIDYKISTQHFPIVYYGSDANAWLGQQSAADRPDPGWKHMLISSPYLRPFVNERPDRLLARMATPCLRDDLLRGLRIDDVAYHVYQLIRPDARWYAQSQRFTRYADASPYLNLVVQRLDRNVIL